MTQTTARIKKTGKNFEIIVDMEKALSFKKGLNDSTDFLEIDEIFTDSKKGFKASEEDKKSAFGTGDIFEIAKKIAKEGEILVTQDYRDEEREKKIKQVVEFLTINATNPQTGRPHTPERIKIALDEAQIHIKNTPIDTQINEIVNSLKAIIPIRIETRKVKLTIPAIHTGKAYGVINQYKETENWLNDGSLEMVVSVPSGLIMDFYDKLNSVTHGSALTEELKE